MPQDLRQSDEFTRPLRRILQAVIILCLLGVFMVWRIDSPRVERFRSHVIDRVMPSFTWAMAPVMAITELALNFQSYQNLYEQNQELRRELQQMKSWKEAALQLEQENARLLDLNKVRLDPDLTRVTGVVLADSGSPFRQSVLLNVGARDGILDGWATMDGLGLVGRISGVGAKSSRVILLTDASSRIPASIEPSGQSVLIVGDNTLAPPIDFIENPELVRPATVSSPPVMAKSSPRVVDWSGCKRSRWPPKGAACSRLRTVKIFAGAAQQKPPRRRWARNFGGAKAHVWQADRGRSGSFE